MKPAEHRLTVAPEEAGARLDKWLAAALPQQSRSRLKALIEDGAVAIDGRRESDPARKLKAGQAVAIAIPAPRDATPQPQAMDLAIVYEDDALIVVDKPAGLVVHPAPGNPERTLVNALLAHCGNSLAGIGGVRRPGIVHRIDKDTSGLLVVAKTDAAHAGLAAQFKEHSIERVYDAFVWGVPHPAKGVITGAIGRSPSNRKKMAIVARGKAAETHYATDAVFGKLAARVKCRLMTGRTHQIRVHMASKGHSLIGDATYGRPVRGLKQLDPELAKTLTAFPRQALHAGTLGFVHPTTGERLSFTAPLPDDLLRLNQMLQRI